MNNLQYRIWSKKYKMFTSDPQWPNNQSSHELHLLSPDGKVVELVGDGYNWQEVTDVKQSEFVVQRYTGLKDSKGKKIFEGDIIQFGKYKCSVTISPFGVLARIKFDDYRFIADYDMDSIKVIGNVLQK